MLRYLVIVLVFLSGLFVLISQTPERVFARSLDGVVEVHGVSRVVRRVVVDPIPHNDFTLIPAPPSHAYTARYTIDADKGGTDFAPTVTFLLSPEGVDQSWENLPRLYQWNDTIQLWEELESYVDFSAQTIEAVVPLGYPATLVVASP